MGIQKSAPERGLRGFFLPDFIIHPPVLLKDGRSVVSLDQAAAGTVFTQTIVYASKQERDGDFKGVVTSASEVYANLARYLESLR